MTDELVCSRAGCRLPAVHAVIWSNPRIHRDGREKTWLACSEHHDFLHDYLAARGFPVRVELLGARAVARPAQGRS